MAYRNKVPIRSNRSGYKTKIQIDNGNNKIIFSVIEKNFNKIKLFLGVVLFGVMSFGAFSTYDYYTMSEEERFMLANIEALTQDEGTSVLMCFMRVGLTGKFDQRRFCATGTDATTIYDCLEVSLDYFQDDRIDRCTN